LQEHGIPTVVFGPGNIDQAHNVDEFVNIDEIGYAAEIFVQLAKLALR
jgi:acetylornithine deacetylase/succinyl-diaminopimelate desuccinylase-like protein